MPTRTTSKKAGFTLVEMLIVIFISTLLVLGVSTLVITIIKTSRQQIRSTGDIFQSTLTAANFANELRNMSIGNDGSYQINQAGDTQLIFYSSFGASGLAVNRIRYYLATTSTTTILYKGVVTPTGSPLTYNLGLEVVRTIQTDIASGTTKIFYYYDGNYNGSTTPLTQPVNVTGVKFISLSMSVVSQPELSTTTYPITIGATLRNLKNNLGN
jgi:prepilin-type N-terminal cleavage/methylation domain-containing protein